KSYNKIKNQIKQYAKRIFQLIKLKKNQMREYKFFNYQQNQIYLKLITGSKYLILYKRRLKHSSNSLFQFIKNKVNGKGNLLMVFKSKSNYIFGAYSPCVWKLCDAGQYGEDNTISSFMFSQIYNLIYPLMQEYKSYAIHCNTNLGTFIWM
ncbi:unnamed protein product, partial (macronuclear) [Paramecium tetraurelia]